ncbi:hypothetical protein M404DRAFT_764774 [Pisolithus tinctorius Marx 270]|uniref:Uncharacterized protein n=1 Tax=Pisolithus tinctorius Marx 270 TaxID=870435 RepID=A0A0C3NYX6_PISTI|nr:hypothetical protein M404DRAFT_764774 [Pisolithus tinctorius Marx 270]
MAPRRIKKWFKSLGSGSRRPSESDPNDLAPAATGTATAEARDLVGDVAIPVPAWIEAAPQEITSP